MAREIKNVAASIRARLLNNARESKRDFQLVLTHFALERLLYRLSLSRYKSRFVLKGALLFNVWLDDPFRPTRDLDLLGLGDPETDKMVAIFRQVISRKVTDDGLVFDVEDLRATSIREDARYGGIRIETTATLERARVPIQVDIGFGDAITPAAEEIDYPTLLGTPTFRLRAYPRETVVAEKLEALVMLGFTNSRMKDFYDLAQMARHFDFDGPRLVQAVRSTFTRRRTEIPAATPDGLSDAFASQPEVAARWRAFLTRERLAADVADFTRVIKKVRKFLAPVLSAARGTTSPAPRRWPAGGPWRK
ncbi:MAG: nucleotidyl transferase AbiEii/AbiGii toxin family protein [Alphaproteobacteria bacterium]|nr:nucleotidyl transferase AbiEii/AbiGii toxin family protein [Alphaproteobacteria bacterium]